MHQVSQRKVENGGYNPEKDVQLYNEQPDMYFQLTNGQFVIFFPEDVHAPMIGEGDIKKLVIKVKLWVVNGITFYLFITNNSWRAIAILIFKQ